MVRLARCAPTRPARVRRDGREGDERFPRGAPPTTFGARRGQPRPGLRRVRGFPRARGVASRRDGSLNATERARAPAVRRRVLERARAFPAGIGRWRIPASQSRGVVDSADDEADARGRDARGDAAGRNPATRARRRRARRGRRDARAHRPPVIRAQARRAVWRAQASSAILRSDHPKEPANRRARTSNGKSDQYQYCSVGDSDERR